MSVIVIGCGRSGTNVALEILSGHSFLSLSDPVENKKIISGNLSYPDWYLTKCDTCYFSFEQLDRYLKANSTTKLIYTIRDPRDMILSKIRRGQLISEGGDCETLADDATPEGCIDDILHAHSLYLASRERYAERILLVKLENMLLHTESSARSMCTFLGLTFEVPMVHFYLRMHNQFKKKRYGQKVDLSQIAIWKRWEEIYDGWFLQHREYDVETLFNNINSLVRYYGYPTE